MVPSPSRRPREGYLSWRRRPVGTLPAPNRPWAASPCTGTGMEPIPSDLVTIVFHEADADDDVLQRLASAVLDGGRDEHEDLGEAS